MAGRVLGDYEIISQLAERGGMAVVYVAWQSRLGRRAALKEVDLRGGHELIERFVREARLAGSLNHPNVVTVFDFFEHDGVPYIAMEYLERGSLRPWLGSVDRAQAYGVLEGMLAGLAHAHGQGIVHRDIKPENLLVTDAGNIKITDFGIARAFANVTSRLTHTGMTVGTPMYMSPEQAMNRPLTPATDLYAVGVVAFELLLGRLPFPDGDNPLAILLQHVNEPVPDVRALDPTLDPEIAAWVERMLAKAPEARPASAQEAWEQLEESVVRTLGPLWRRGARLLPTQDPLTPAPFEAEPPPERRETAPPAGEAPAPPPERRDTAPPALSSPARAATPPPALPLVAASPRVVVDVDDAPASRPRRRGLVVAFAAVVVLAGVGVTVALTHHGSSPPPKPTPGATATANPVAGGMSALTVFLAVDGSQGEALTSGARLALDEAHAQAGGHPITLTAVHGSPTANANQAGHAAAYIGDFGSDDTARSMPILNQAGVAQISPTAAASDLTSSAKLFPSGRRTFARIFPTDAVQGAALAALMQRDGCTQVALADDGKPYGKKLAQSVQAAATLSGLAILSDDRLDPGAQSYADQARKAASGGADCFMFGGERSSNATQVFADFGAALPSARLYGGDALAQASFATGVPPSLEIALTGAALSTGQFPARPPALQSPYAVYGYEAMRLALDAIKRSDGTQAGIVQSLFATEKRDSALGRYSIDDNGDTTLRTFGIDTVKDGKLAFTGTITAP